MTRAPRNRANCDFKAQVIIVATCEQAVVISISKIEVPLSLEVCKSKVSIYTGFREFDFEKLVNVILYFASKVPNFYKTKLMKCLWYADMLAFKR